MNEQPDDLRPEDGVADTALAIAERQDPRALTKDEVDGLEDRLELVRRVRHAVIRLTTPAQWKDFSGNPYMEGDAAMTIASGVGLIINEPKFKFRDLGDVAWQCICEVTVEKNGREFTDVGDCDSFDDFLKARKEKLENDGATPAQIAMLVQVEARKKAYANAMSRAVSGWTGLRGLSWEDLGALGLAQEKAGSIQHRKGVTKGAKIPQVASIEELGKIPTGSTVDFTGQVRKVTTRQGAKGEYCDVVIADAGGGCTTVRLWHEKPEWLESGCFARFAELKIGEYNKRRQYATPKIEESDPPTQETEGGQPEDDQYAGRPNDPEAF